MLFITLKDTEIFFSSFKYVCAFLALNSKIKKHLIISDAISSLIKGNLLNKEFILIGYLRLH
jgi:hypothetical protein